MAGCSLLVDRFHRVSDVILLVDGSSERAIDGMMGDPIRFGKLVDRLPLDPRISSTVWREELPERFEQAGLAIGPKGLEALIAFGDGKPYATMSAARYAALNGRKLGGKTVDAFEVEEGIAEARRHLGEDS